MIVCCCMDQGLLLDATRSFLMILLSLFGLESTLGLNGKLVTRLADKRRLPFKLKKALSTGQCLLVMIAVDKRGGRGSRSLSCVNNEASLLPLADDDSESYVSRQ